METEITVQVFAEEDETISNLQKQGFEIKSQFSMFDSYFSKHSLSRLKKMKYKNVIASSFLIRHLVGAKGEKTQLVYKNKVVKNDIVLMEEKIVSMVDSKENAISVFENAGLTNWCNANQHLTVMEKGSIVFALQKVEGLGLFIEYEEDETVGGETAEEKIEIMKNRLVSLGLEIGDDYACKKPFMILNKN